MIMKPAGGPFEELPADLIVDITGGRLKKIFAYPLDTARDLPLPS